MDFANQRSYTHGNRSASCMNTRQREFNLAMGFKTDYLETYKASVTSVLKTQSNNPEGSHWTKDSKVIKFTGNMKDNIQGLLRNLECKCGVGKDFAQMINAFGDKITRLREERARHKENAVNFKRHIQTLQNELHQRNKQMQQLEENYYIQRRDSVPKSQVDKAQKQYHATYKKCEQLQFSNEMLRRQLKQVQQQCQHLNNRLLVAEKELCDRNIKWPKDQTCLLDFSHSDRHERHEKQQHSLHQSALILKLQRYQNLFKQLPMEFQEVGRMLKEYANDLPTFASQQQRELYFMATRMNSNLWKKKLELQIKDLCEKREALKKLEEDVGRRKHHPLQPIVNGFRQ